MHFEIKTQNLINRKINKGCPTKTSCRAETPQKNDRKELRKNVNTVKNTRTSLHEYNLR